MSDLAWVPRVSGLVERIELPELTMEQAIERGWERRDDGRLMEPIEPEGPFLQTHPIPWGDPTPRLRLVHDYMSGWLTGA